VRGDCDEFNGIEDPEKLPFIKTEKNQVYIEAKGILAKFEMDKTTDNVSFLPQILLKNCVVIITKFALFV